MNEQQTRRERLRTLMDEHRCWPCAHPNGPKLCDYDDSYAELAAYLGVEVNDSGEEIVIGEPARIPRYASLRGDETYTVIDLSDTLSDGVTAVTGGIGEEYLMNPEQIIDLDTGVDVPFCVVGLSEEAFTVLCGLVAPDWLTSEDPTAVNHAGIFSDAWDELRAKFPVDHFHKVARARGEDFYHEEAGT
jgi:hypothetical protein